MIFNNLNAGRSQTVVAYGTSLTHGGAWVSAAKEWFNQQYPCKANFINSGGPGQNSDWGVHNLKTKVLDFHPNLVFVEFSYNDAHDKFHMPVQRGAANLEMIVECIHAQNPEIVVVLQIMNVGWDAPNGNRSHSVRPKLELYNDNYRSLAHARSIALLDHSIAWSTLKTNNLEQFKKYIPDGSHPSEEGSLAVTWPAVRTWLEANRASAKETLPFR